MIMDKESLNTYGWIIVVTIVIAIFISFATPFKTTIQNSAEDIIFSSVEQKTGTNENILNLDSSGLEK